jgi:branched-chain amino acid transport system ATP-binding protein
MLELVGVTARYSKVDAIRDVSVTVRKGELVGLIGLNGAGKSTTLAAALGVVPAAAGKIDFEGQSVLGCSPDEIVRRGMVLVPEGRHIFTTLTVAENLQLGQTPLPRGTDGAADLDSVLERFPVLGERYRQAAGKLSGGEQQQLAIGRALLARPRLMLLDEPSLGLAPRVVDLVFEALEDLRREGMTILLVEQNATRTVAFADRTYVMRTGEVVLEGTREELATRDDLISTYLGS